MTVNTVFYMAREAKWNHYSLNDITIGSESYLGDLDRKCATTYGQSGYFTCPQPLIDYNILLHNTAGVLEYVSATEIKAFSEFLIPESNLTPYFREDYYYPGSHPDNAIK